MLFKWPLHRVATSRATEKTLDSLTLMHHENKNYATSKTMEELFIKNGCMHYVLTF